MEYTIGIDLGGTNIKGIIVDTDFRPVIFKSKPTPQVQSLQAIFEAIIDFIREVLSEAKTDKKSLRGIGMGVPGLCDSSVNKVFRIPFFKMTDVDVAKPLKDFFGVPVYIENDGNVMLLGEQYFGAGKGYGDILALGLGTGMACGISVEGRLLHGRNHVAAEVGHMVIDSEGGEQCVCGKRGCFESCCSATAMKRYARRFASDSPKSLLHEYCGGNIPAIGGEMIDRGFDAGDDVCKKVYDIFTDKLSVGLVNLINIFNPEIIVIGGGVAHAGDRLLVPVREKVRKSLMHPVQECPIVAGRLLSRAGVMGACRLVDLHS